MEPQITDPVKIIRDRIKEFEPYEILSYVALLDALPGNENKFVRLETLCKVILSTRQKKFKNLEFGKDDIAQLLDDLDSFHDWSPLEDVIPVSLLDHPGVWLLGRRYHIFTGIEYRFSDFWRQLISDMYPVRKSFHAKGYDPIHIIEDILSLQSRLVSVIYEHKDSISKIGDVSVPSPELFESWKHTINQWYQQTPHQSFYAQHSVSLGRKMDQSLITEPDLLTPSTFFSVDIAGRTVLIFQRGLLNCLSALFLDDFKSLHQQNPSLLYDSSDVLLRHLSKLFLSENILPHFSVNDLEEVVDFATIFDSNKLFLFKIIHPDFADDSDEHLKESVNKLKKITRYVPIGKTNFKTFQTSVEVSESIQYETISILLVNSLYDMPPKTGLRIDSDTFLIIPFHDFIAICNEIKDGMKLLKFLRYYHGANKEFSPDARMLDVYTAVFCDVDSFLPPDSLFGYEYVWDQYYMHKLRTTPNFQPRLDEDEPADLWDANPISDKVFQMYDAQAHRLASVFRLNDDRAVWILPSNTVLDYHPNELHAFNLLMQLVPFRLTSSNTFETFLQKCGMDSVNQMRFVLYPTSFIKRRGLQDYNKFLPLASNDEGPVFVRVNHVPNADRPVFDIIFSLSHLSKLSKSDYLSAEKAIIRSILSEISRQSLQLSVDEIDKFTEEIFEDDSSDFNITPMNNQSLLLSTLTSANHPKIPSENMFDIYNQIQECVAERAIIGPQSTEDARYIVDEVINHLERSLIEKLHQYSLADILSYAVRVNSTLYESRYITQYISKDDYGYEEYNISTRYYDKDLKLSELSAMVRYIAELAIRINPQGDSLLSDERWLEIQAYFGELGSYVFARNAIDLKPDGFTLTVDHDHTARWDSSDDGINALIEYSKHFDNDVPVLPIESTSTFDLNGMFDDVNPSFLDEFGVSFEDFLKVLECCVSLSHDKSKHIVIVDYTSLILDIQSVSGMDKDAVTCGLKLASLAHGDLVDTKIYPIDIKNTKLRSLVKPIPVFQRGKQKMCVLNSLSIIISKHRWFEAMRQGHLPFLISGSRQENATSDKLTMKLQEMQQDVISEHKREINDIMRQKTVYCHSDAGSTSKVFSQIPENIVGVIDSLSIHPSLKQVILIEAKQFYWNMSLDEIKDEMLEYTSDGGYIEVLSQKMQYVKKYLSAILRYHGLDSGGGGKEDEEDWQVKGYFVTTNDAFPVVMPPRINIINISKLDAI